MNGKDSIRPLIIKVEVLAGVEINDACRHLCDVANEFRIAVATEFNRCELFIPPGSKPQDVVDEYRTLLKLTSP